MSAFGNNLDAKIYANKYQYIEKALQEKNDGSWEEFQQALADPLIPATSISRAITKVTGLYVSDRSVSAWRRSLYGGV